MLRISSDDKEQTQFAADYVYSELCNQKGYWWFFT